LVPGVHGLVGPNGAGKSTMFSAIAGTQANAKGDVILEGAHASRLGRRKAVALAANPSHFYPTATFAQHVAFLRPFYPDWSRSEEARLVERLSIPLTKRVGEASQGMLSKFGLLVAFARRAHVVLLDEPWNALDVESRDELTQIVRDLTRDSCRSVIISSHDLNELQEVCGDILFMADGKIKHQISTQALVERFATTGRAALVDAYRELRT